MAEGFFITLEGVDGCGKSTQAQRLQKYLIKKGIAVVSTREPGGTMLAEAIRCLLLEPCYSPVEAWAEVFLYAAARVQHVAQRILPALEAGKTVICDRYMDSSIAYQGYGRALGAEKVLQVNALAVGGLKPDLTLIIDVPVEISLRRRRSKTAADRLEREDLDFYRRVRQGYLQLSRQEPERIYLIDGSGAPQTVWLQIKKIIDVAMGLSKDVKQKQDCYNNYQSGQ